MSLAEHKWRRRLLLIFAPDEADGKLAEQKRLLEGSESDFEQRSLVPIHALEDDEARGKFEVEAGAFAVVLVGKDGAEKFRSEEPVEPEELFRRIDEMPMRRREMDSQ